MFLAVRISSYGCTWEVWRALKKLEYASLVLSSVHISLICDAKDEQTLKNKT